MASVSLDSFLPEVLPECAGVPYPVAINAIRNACYDFCKESLIWNAVQDAEAYTTGNASYQILPPSGAQVVAVISVNMDEQYAIEPSTLEDVVIARPAWASSKGIVETFVQPQPDTITFVAVPDKDGVYIATAAFAPTRTATTIDSLVYNQHLETIKYGALWKLKQMFGQPWSDPAGAQYNEGHFWMGVGAATVARNRGNSRASLRVQSRPFI